MGEGIESTKLLYAKGEFVHSFKQEIDSNYLVPLFVEKERKNDFHSYNEVIFSFTIPILSHFIRIVTLYTLKARDKLPCCYTLKYMYKNISVSIIRMNTATMIMIM